MAQTPYCYMLDLEWASYECGLTTHSVYTTTLINVWLKFLASHQYRTIQETVNPDVNEIYLQGIRDDLEFYKEEIT